MSSDDFAVATASGAVALKWEVTAPVTVPITVTFGISGALEYGYSRIANSALGCGIDF